MAYFSSYRFLAKSIEDGKVYENRGSTKGESKVFTASIKERRFFPVMIGGRDKKTGKTHALSGQATFHVFLVDLKDAEKENPTPISNTIEITADLDKLKK